MKFDIWMLLARLHFSMLDNKHYVAGYPQTNVEKETND